MTVGPYYFLATRATQYAAGFGRLGAAQWLPHGLAFYGRN
jgi:hypothetical protein